MPKKFVDLNRIRKVYPLVRARPRFATIQENLEALEVARLEFTGDSGNKLQQVYTFVDIYDEIPVVVITPENENVNAYIVAISTQSVTIEISEVPEEEDPCTVYVHIQVVGK